MVVCMGVAITSRWLGVVKLEGSRSGRDYLLTERELGPQFAAARGTI